MSVPDTNLMVFVSSKGRFRLLILMLIIWLFPKMASACSCVQIGPPCQAAWLHADAVFAAQVYWSWPHPTKRDGIEVMRRMVKMKVLEPFIGGESGWITVETGSGGGDCGYGFSWGERYLVYAFRGKDGSFSTSICTRTQKLSNATADLEYLRTIKSLPATGRVYGTVKQYSFDPNFKPAEVSIMSPYGGREEDVVSMRALPGTPVHLKSNEGHAEAMLRADSNGGFAFNNLAPGRYLISVDLPKQMKPWKSQEIIVPGKGCSAVSIRTAFNGRVSGRVTDKTGAAVAYAAVEIVRASEANGAERAFQWITADRNGAFEIGPLPPGTYVIGVNITKYGPDAQKPRTYYPGTPKIEGAKRVLIKEGQLVSGLDFQLDTQIALAP